MTAVTRDLAGELRAALDAAESEGCVMAGSAFFRQLADDHDAAVKLATLADSYTAGRVQELTVQVERALRLWVGGATDDDGTTSWSAA